MNKQLLEQLKVLDMLPIEVDTEALEELRKEGIDVSRLETHYNPGTPEHAIERYEKIHRNVLRLFHMERDCRVDLAEYRRVEEELRTDTFESTFPPAKEVIMRMFGTGKPATGVCGVYRDFPPFHDTSDIKKSPYHFDPE